MRRVTRKWRTFWREPLRVRLWLVPAWFLLGIYRAMILRRPFRELARGFGESLGVSAVLPLIDDRQVRTARWIARVVSIAARYTPWESNCFPQALAARFLLDLHRVPFAMYFGLAKTPNAQGLAAHAWVAAGPVAVSGGYSFDRYAVVGVYVAAGWLPGQGAQVSGRPQR